MALSKGTKIWIGGMVVIIIVGAIWRPFRLAQMRDHFLVPVEYVEYGSSGRSGFLKFRYIVNDTSYREVRGVSWAVRDDWRDGKLKNLWAIVRKGHPEDAWLILYESDFDEYGITEEERAGKDMFYYKGD